MTSSFFQTLACYGWISYFWCYLWYSFVIFDSFQGYLYFEFWWVFPVPAHLLCLFSLWILPSVKSLKSISHFLRISTILTYLDLPQRPHTPDVTYIISFCSPSLFKILLYFELLRYIFSSTFQYHEYYHLSYFWVFIYLTNLTKFHSAFFQHKIYSKKHLGRNLWYSYYRIWCSSLSPVTSQLILHSLLFLRKLFDQFYQTLQIPGNFRYYLQ